MILAVCIPTHDGRSEVLRRALESVIGQLDGDLADQVQVCVSDNASQDGTQELVEELGRRLGERLVYHRNPKNLGLVPNLIRSVEIARADFCWLLGSDDVIAAGGIETVVELLREHPDTSGVTVNRSRVNFWDRANHQLDPARELPADPDRVHVYRDADSIFLNVGLPQDYMSTQVLDRERFLAVVAEVPADELRSFHDFAHLFILGRMVQRDPTWIWHPGLLVHHTTGTSALDEQLGHDYSRYLLAVMEGRSRAWGALLGPRSAVFRGVMTKAYLRSALPSALVNLKLWGNHRTRSDVLLLAGMVRHFWWLPTFWTRSFPVLLVPHAGLKLLQRAYRRLTGRASGGR